jgi:hypothetical protein
METKSTYLGTMISLATVAFGLVVAAAWNAAIQSIITTLLAALGISLGKAWIPQTIYAIIITIVAIWIVNSLGKLAERGFGPKL